MASACEDKLLVRSEHVRWPMFNESRSSGRVRDLGLITQTTHPWVIVVAVIQTRTVVNAWLCGCEVRLKEFRSFFFFNIRRHENLSGVSSSGEWWEFHSEDGLSGLQIVDWMTGLWNRGLIVGKSVWWHWQEIIGPSSISLTSMPSPPSVCACGCLLFKCLCSTFFLRLLPHHHLHWDVHRPPWITAAGLELPKSVNQYPVHPISTSHWALAEPDNTAHSLHGLLR